MKWKCKAANKYLVNVVYFYVFKALVISMTFSGKLRANNFGI